MWGDAHNRSCWGNHQKGEAGTPGEEGSVFVGSRGKAEAEAKAEAKPKPVPQPPAGHRLDGCEKAHALTWTSLVEVDILFPVLCSEALLLSSVCPCRCPVGLFVCVGGQHRRVFPGPSAVFKSAPPVLLVSASFEEPNSPNPATPLFYARRQTSMVPFFSPPIETFLRDKLSMTACLRLIRFKSFVYVIRSQHGEKKSEAKLCASLECIFAGLYVESLYGNRISRTYEDSGAHLFPRGRS